MDEILGVFSNRELALASWLCLIILFVIFSFGRSQTVKDLINSFFSTPVLLIFSLSFLYSFSTLGFLVFFNENLLTLSTLKLFVVWFLFSAFPSIFSFTEVQQDVNGFVNSSVKKVIALTLIIDFINELSVFSYSVEVLLIGLVTFFTFVLNVSLKDENRGHEILKKIGKSIIGVIALIMIINFISQIIDSYNNEELVPVIHDLLITIYLSILFIPVIILLSKYSRLESIYTAVNFQVRKGEKLTVFEFLYVLYRLGFNITNLGRWRDLVVMYSGKASKDSFYIKIDELLQTIKRENLDVAVPFENGWSSEKARFFLKPIVSEMGFYKEIEEEIWHASSTSAVIKSEGSLENNIKYYIEGNSDLVNQLKIVGNMNSKLEEEEFFELFSKSANRLFEAAFKCSVPIEIIKKLNTFEAFNASFKGKSISLVREIWSNDDRYYLKFIIQSPPRPFL
jgi:hypothetical protein